MPARPLLRQGHGGHAWWLWLASASFIGYFAFIHLNLYYERQSYYFVREMRSNGIHAARVSPGGPADRMGLQPGDRLVAMNGLRIDNGNDFSAAMANEAIGVPGKWLVERDGQTIALATPALPRVWIVPALAFPLGSMALGLSVLLGVAILWRGPQDLTGRLGAGLLLSLGCAFLPLFPNSIATQWRSFPVPVAMLLAPAAISSTMIHFWLVAFCATVTRTPFTRTQAVIAMAPGAAVGAVVLWYCALVAYTPRRAVEMWLPDWFNFVGPLVYPLYFFGGAWLLIAGLRRVTDATERRRLQILLAGIACGSTGLFVFGLLLGMQRTGMATPGDAALIGVMTLFTLLPLSFAYATLRHRLFDLRFIVRLGLQYALARGLVAALIPIAVGALIADAALHADQSLRAILADRGWGYATVAAIATVIFVKRTEWMTMIDRRFFRERYAAQQILSGVVEDLGGAGDLNAAAQRVIGRIDSALHPVTAAVMIKPRTATAFSSIASSGHATPAMPANSPLAQVARALGTPVVAGSLGITGAADLVVPIAVDTNGDEALLVLGPRKSEEPYSKEDRDLLSAIAASLRLLMGRTDSTALPTVAVSAGPPTTLLASRYRIDRPIGEGGMGAVYAATDTTLQRDVAVKVIKAQHITGEALTRFQHEARTAASLSHPHIVTIHDFGTDDNGAPFLVMELLSGRTLRHAIATDGPMTVARATAILSGLASAVEAAHAKGIIHRDLKPENVFLVADTHAKILDYGIAKIAGVTGTNTTGGVLGTLAYMSPEQASGGTPSPSWDVWALSVMAFEMLTGRHPFGGGLPVTRATPVRALAPDLDESVASAVDASLSLSPSERRGRFWISS